MNHIRDNKGKLLGWTETNSNGYTYVYSTKKGMLGFYIPSEDITYYAGGGLVGFGNQLVALLY